MAIFCSSSENGEDLWAKTSDNYNVEDDKNALNLCSAESCEDLQNRVANLEEALRVIVSALASQQKSRLLATISKSIVKSSAVQSIFLASRASSTNKKEAASDSIVFPTSTNSSFAGTYWTCFI